MKIYVGRLSFKASEQDLKKFFKDSGFEVDRVSICTDRKTGRSRGFAFVTINDEDQALQAIKVLNGHKMMEMNLILNEAEDKPREDSGRRNHAQQQKNSSKPGERRQREPQPVPESGFDYVIPKTTKDAITADGKERDIDNLHLRLNAFATMSEEGNDHKKKFNFNGKTLLAAIPPEIKTVIDCIKSQQDVVVRELKAETASRLVVGLGSESVYEVSMTLHHIYGTPYIPGQSLKGAVRNFIISEKFDKKEKEALKNDDFCSVFGKQDGAGKVMFYDAYPDEDEIQLEKDVMTPHYPDYYGGNGIYPTDTQSPRPIKFLTVKKGVKFRFFLGTKKGDAALLDKAAEYLKEALEKSGVGAKTAVGYGYFNKFKEVK